jgi:hypothetical protein
MNQGKSKALVLSLASAASAERYHDTDLHRCDPDRHLHRQAGGSLSGVARWRVDLLNVAII